MSKLIFSFCAFVLLAITPSVRADTFVITSGSVSLVGTFGGISYSLAGPGFSINGGGEGGQTAQARRCIPCLPGTVVSSSVTVTGSGVGSGSATINGQSFQGIPFFGTIQLSGGSFVVPMAFTDVTFTSGANLFASIIGCQSPFSPCDPSNPVFSVTLQGSGTATLNLVFSGVNHDGIPLFSFRSLIFDFGSPIQTPEPMTITLLGAGVAGLAAKLRLGRRKRRQRGVH